MSLLKLVVIGALVMGTWAPIPSYSAEAVASVETPSIFVPSSSEELAYLMHREGIHRTVQREERADLATILQFAENRIKEQEITCTTSALQEVRLLKSSYEWIAGYAIIMECEDTPSPALAFYFDVDLRFLATFEF